MSRGMSVGVRLLLALVLVFSALSLTDAIRQLSDSRLKTDVRQIRDALGAVQQLRGVQFEWRHELFSRPGAMYAQAKRGLNLGFIAQEVQPVVPQVVSQNSDGFMEVDYSSIVPLLVESIKEQQVMIQTLQEENRQFRTDISAKYDALVEADREEVLRSKDATSQIEAQVVALTANGKTLEEQVLALFSALCDLDGEACRQARHRFTSTASPDSMKVAQPPSRSRQGNTFSGIFGRR